MSKQLKRRKTLRKRCHYDVDIVGPSFRGRALIDEISTGGFILNWNSGLFSNIEIGSRFRIALPVAPPQKMILIGGQLIWKENSRGGASIVHSNCHDSVLEKLVNDLEG